MNEFNPSSLHPRLNDKRETRTEDLKLDLSSLADQLNSIAAMLRSDETFGVRRLSGATDAVPPDLRKALREKRSAIEVDGDLNERRSVYADLARETYATRRRRGAIFDGNELFGEPAWDILLDLYVAHVEAKAVSVSSACIGSAAPPTTGLRWLGVLAEQGLVVREHDPDDQRRVLVRLTERGLTAMDEYFAGVGKAT
ncbi:MAG: winged helix DNA-binding protein [Erythrobacter sp.]